MARGYTNKSEKFATWTDAARAALLFLCAFLLLASSSACSSSDSDLGKINDNLEDRLTDALCFENRSIENGTAPAGLDGAEAPQIEEVDVPAELHDGLDFAVRLTSAYSHPENVTQAVVRVKGATKHIMIKASFISSAEKPYMSLFGNLNEDAMLKGKSFEIEYALQTADGVTGAYVAKSLKVADTEPECDAGLCCNGGQWIEEGAQCLKNDELACTGQTCDAGHECATALLEETCLIGGICYVPYDLNPENECEKCWPEESTDSWSPYDSASCDAGGGPYSGYCEGGVCLPLADGDGEAAESDGDREIDSAPDGDIEGVELESEASTIWNDDQNGLGWELNASQDEMNLNDCSIYCDDKNADGSDGVWRMPTISELRGLVRNCEFTVSEGSCQVIDDCASSAQCRDETCDGCGGDIACYIVEELADNCGVYQSATLDDEDGNYIWSIDFGAGAINPVLWNELHLCRCVKSQAR